LRLSDRNHQFYVKSVNNPIFFG